MRARRGSSMLEFVLLVPFVVALMLMSVDVGRLALAVSALQDSVAVASRASARLGYAGSIPAGSLCQTPAGADDVAYRVFCESSDRMPIATPEQLEILTPVTVTTLGRTCSSTEGSELYVTIRATATVTALTPGVGVLFGAPGVGFGEQTIVATATARCEVAR